MDKIFKVVDSFIEKAEHRYGKVTIMLLIGCIFLLLAALVSTVNWQTSYHGNGFTRLSEHPFDLENENDLRYRILSPLLGYLLFLRGPLFKFFMLAVLALFFGFIYFFMRRDKYYPSESIGITALCVFSTLSFYQFYFPAYVDPLSFLLILFFMFFHRKTPINIILLSLMLFNHENTIFLFPFFYFLSVNGDFSTKNFIRISLYFFIAIVPYLIFRKIISMHSIVEYDASYYFDSHNMEWSRQHVLPHLLSGIWQAFRLTWIFPLAAIIVDVYEKRYREIFLILVAVLFVLMQMVFAWDISRLVGMSFPIIIISAMRMKTFLGYRKFLLVTYSVLLINFFIPAYCIGALDPIPYTLF